MSSWQEYKNIAKERGSLAYELFVIISSPEKPDQLKSVLPEHLAYQAELEASGSLVLAGPLSDLTGESMEGVGMIVYRAESFEAAQALADGDPMHKQGVRSYVLRRWLINEGNLTLNVKLSAQQVRL